MRLLRHLVAGAVLALPCAAQDPDPALEGDLRVVLGRLTAANGRDAALADAWAAGDGALVRELSEKETAAARAELAALREDAAGDWVYFAEYAPSEAVAEELKIERVVRLRGRRGDNGGAHTLGRRAALARTAAGWRWIARGDPAGLMGTLLNAEDLERRFAAAVLAWAAAPEKDVRGANARLEALELARELERGSAAKGVERADVALKKQDPAKAEAEADERRVRAAAMAKNLRAAIESWATDHGTYPRDGDRKSVV